MPDTAPVGRPTIYTPELAERICVAIVEGNSLRSICARDDSSSSRASFLAAIGGILQGADTVSTAAKVRFEDLAQPTPERIAHGRIDRIQGRGHLELEGDAAAWKPGKLVQRRRIPVEFYYTRHWITRRQRNAARKLQQDYELGLCGASRPDIRVGPSGGRSAGISEARLFALRAYQGAVAHLGKRRCEIVLPVVCEEIDVSTLAEKRQGDRKEVMALLKHGLDELADHYGY